MTGKSLFAKMVLLPCSKVYGAVTYVRNKLFDYKILRQTEFDVPVIVVGNLAAGGTGKTPLVEYLIRHLETRYHIAILSRGFKRSTKGFVLAGPSSTPRDIGDESFQIYRKFGSRIRVAVCEQRVEGIQRLLEIDPGINLLILDDAFQHRYVKPTVSILVTEYSRPVYRDNLLPYGLLRESSKGMNRADIVVVSKCPESLQPIDYLVVKKEYELFPYQQLYFSRLAYCRLEPLFPDTVSQVPYLEYMTSGDSILAVAGIGNPRPFVQYLKSFNAKVKVDVYPDHHNYTRKDIEHLKKRYGMLRGNRRIIVTTEKDAMRLATNPYFPHELKAATFYLPVEVEFVERTTPMPLEEAVEKHIRPTRPLHR